MASHFPQRQVSSLYEKSLRRNRLRRILLEKLDRRELLAADVGAGIFAGGTSQGYIDAFDWAVAGGGNDNNGGSGSDNFNAPGDRWSNPVGGPSLNNGDPATISWSIVPDGTTDTANNSQTNLVAFMDGIYGGGSGPVEQRPWFNIFQRAYDRWSEVSGLNFIYEAADDGAPMGQGNRGVAGVRGDVRIGGRPIDGNFGVLAFNYFPNAGGDAGFDGDMIIDTNDAWYLQNADSATGENRGLFNVLMHEAGHGVGLGHSIPLDNTKLMEPAVTFAFLGAQHDDILGAHDLYGDNSEPNDSAAQATNLGPLSNGNQVVSGNSIDRPGDDDWYEFNAASSATLTINLQPIGFQYEIGNQGGATGPVDTEASQDLTVELLASDGSVLAQGNLNGAGQSEEITDFTLPAGGDYRIRVTGTAAGSSDPQLYELSITAAGLTDPEAQVTPPRLLSVAPNVGRIFSFNKTDQLTQAPDELVLRFGGSQPLDPASFDGIRITRAGQDESFDEGNEVVLTPGFIGFADSDRTVVARFAETLPDDLYRVEVFGVDDTDAGITAVRNAGGEALRPRIEGTDRDTIFFDLELGNKIVAVVHQPTSRDFSGNVVQARDQIEIYFSDEDRMHPTDVATGDVSPNPTVVSPSFYQLFADFGTISNVDDELHNPTSVSYSADRNMVTLTFAGDISELTADNSNFRLRVGTNEAQPAAPNVIAQNADPGSTFTEAAIGDNNFGTFSSLTSVEVSEQIVNPEVFPLDFPGAPDTPSDRELLDDPNPNENHFIGDAADSDVGISRIYYTYNTVESFGTNDQGISLFSSITEQQKNRSREAFEFYGALLGIDFIETEETSLPSGDRVLWITTGELDGPGNAIGVAGGDLVIMDAAETWDDRFGQSDTSVPGFSYFAVVLHETGHLLGLGHATELPPGTNSGGAYSDAALGGEPSLLFGNDTESIFPGSHDVAHGRYLHRPDSRDIDLYRFEVDANSAGLFTAEVVAERLAESSTLDSALTLYQENADGTRSVIAVNDDYFSDDSYMSLNLSPGVYYLGVSASGNSDYDPTITDSGLGGTSEGAYQLRTTFRPLVESNIVDVEGSALDGDGDGIAGGVFHHWFDSATQANTLFVDKAGSAATADGSIANPFTTISDAFNAASPGDTVRIVSNGGADDDVNTQGDNLAYEVGTGGLGGAPLQDGQFMNVPQGVNVVIDAGSLFKMGNSIIGVGSSTSSGDLSRGSLQVLGTPEQQVFFTSYTNENLGVDTDPLSTQPEAGDWGGIIFRNSLDRAEGRFDAELDGRFVNYVGQTNLTYGGGQVEVDGQSQVVTPLHMVTARPTLIYNTLNLSAAAAISADPNSFEESTFVAPRFQAESISTPDYTRVGPDIQGNVLSQNSLNGLFIRVETPPGQITAAQTVAGRWDDTDIVHIIADTLTVAGTPGGPFIETRGPELATVGVAEATVADGQLAVGTAYTYRMTFVDANGNEGIPGTATAPLTLTGTSNAIRLTNLTAAPDGFVARNLYRSDDGGVTFRRIAELDRSSAVHVDSIPLSNVALLDTTTVHRARLDASLVIDPGSVVKLQNGRIVSGIGAQVVAEGSPERQVVFTSRQDDRYGAGSTFDTNNDADATTAVPGDWGGIYFGHMGRGSIDNALITFGGGITAVEGTFAGFNALEIHQAEARIANTVFEDNASGTGGPSGRVREGAGFNEDAVIFVRGAQPIIVDNIIRDNDAPAISIDPHSTNGTEVLDHGRVTGLADRRVSITENKGPLVRGNALANNTTNGMVLRGVTLNNQSVWDDTDIVHAVFDEIVVPDFHVDGGLRLQSSPDESLVVKFGPGAGLTSTGRPLDIDDRIGGTLQVLGSPGFPVILTSISDDSVGAGFGPTGAAQRDTNNNNNSTSPSAGDWRSVRIGEFSNDRNVAVATELEPAQSSGAGINGIPGNAQNLGLLARGEKSSDDNLRLGYVISGTINNTDDVDVYSFTGTAGTEVWLDIDKTGTKLDAVLELVDAEGNILALSDNSLEESTGDVPLVNNLPASNHVNSMQDNLYNPRNFGNSLDNTFADFYSTNPLDPGMRVVLPGATGSVNPYFVRVRSSNIDSRTTADKSDLVDPSKIGDGLTQGQYELQIRLRQTNEVAGSSVAYADIRFATNGVEILGQPGHSPLIGEATELVTLDSGPTVDTAIANALDLGNLANSDRAALGVGGILQSGTDVDWYRFRIEVDATQNSGLAQHLSTVIDVDYADGLSRANTSLWLFYDDQNGRGNNGIRLVNFGTDSNIADDQPAPINGTDIDDLSRGSAGVLDAFIGNSALPSGDYYLAITSNEIVSAYLQQFYARDAGGNPLTRVEPINSVERVLESRDGAGTGVNPVPLNLGDLNLFVSTSSTGTQSDLLSVNPFSGDTISRVSRFNHVEDIAIRGDGTLYGTLAPTLPVFNDASEGGIIQIDTAGNGASNVVSTTSGIQTFFADFTNNPPQAARDFSSDGNQNGAGLRFYGLSYPQEAGAQSLFAVGSRLLGGDTYISASGFLEDATNYVYRLDPTTFAADGVGPDRQNLAQATGAGTQIVEHAHIDTTVDLFPNTESQFIRMRDATAINGEHPSLVGGEDVAIQTPDGVFIYEWEASQLSVTLVADTQGQATAFNDNFIPTNFFQDRSSFGVEVGTETHTFETDTGRLIFNNYQQVADPFDWDGSSFLIQDINGNQVVFEYDSDDQLNNPQAAPVIFDDQNSTVAGVTQALITAIRNPPLISVLDVNGNISTQPWAADAFVLPNTELFTNAQRISVTGDRVISNFPNITGLPGQLSPISVSQLSSAGATDASDGATFTVTDLAGESVTFEFEVSGGTSPGNVPVVLLQQDASFVAQAVEAAINNATAANPNINVFADLVGNGPFTTVEVYGDSFISLSLDTDTITNPVALTPEYGVDGQETRDDGFFLANLFDDGLPPTAGLPGSLDGALLTIESALGGTVVFEFDDVINAPGALGSTNGVVHTPIPYITTTTRATLSQNIAAAINAVNDPTFGVGAFVQLGGDRIQLMGEANVTTTAPPTRLFENGFVGDQLDGSIFSIQDTSGDIITFEFEDTSGNDGTVPGNSVIPIDESAAPTAAAINAAIVAAINAPDANVLADLAGTWEVIAINPATTNQIWMRNATDHAVGSGFILQNFFENLGPESSYEGTTFTVTDADGEVITFELDEINTPRGIEMGNSVVLYDSTGTRSELTQALIDALNSPDPDVLAGLSFWDVTATQQPLMEAAAVQGALSITVNPTPNSQIFNFVNEFTALTGGQSYDGATFTVTDTDGDTITFEFADSSIGNGGSSDNSLVVYDSTTVTEADLTQAISDAINTPDAAIVAGLAGTWDATAALIPNTQIIELSAVTATSVTPAAPETVISNDFPALNAGESYDGATFTIVDADGDSVTFELNDTTDTPPANSGVTAGNSAIDYDPAFTQEQLSQAIADGINNPDPAVLAGATWDAVATLAAGSNQIVLTGFQDLTIDASAAPIINPLSTYDTVSPISTLAGRTPVGVADNQTNPLTADSIAPTNPLVATMLPPASSGAIAVPIEEYYTNTFTFDFNPNLITPGAIDPMVTAINAANIGVTASALGNRLILDGATGVDTTSMPTMLFLPGTPGLPKIPFEFLDTASDLHQTLLQTIQMHDPGARLVIGPGGQEAIQLSATASILEDLTDDSQDNPEANPVLSTAGNFGDLDAKSLVTGLAYDGGEMWAVSNSGDLFKVGSVTFGPNGLELGNFIINSSGQIADHINTILDDDGNRISFSSVTTGPRNTQGGAFADLLFGIDDLGRLFAFTKEGRPANVLENGSWWVDTGIVGASGLAFSTLDVNLWHNSTNRSTDAGHGVNISFDGERVAQTQGGTSLYFGFQDPTDGGGIQPGSWTGVNDPGNDTLTPAYDPTVIYDTYNLPGGAKGSVVSDYLNLSEYSSADKPYLYFNYYLQTESSNSDLSDNEFMRDAFRVFVSGSDGTWSLLGTNNSIYDDTVGVGPLDEHDYLLINESDALVGINQVSELFEANEQDPALSATPDAWRQARIDLSRFAGDDSVRIRFDFSTAGSFDSGNTGSVELISVAASKIQDGDQFVFEDGTPDGVQFEFDMGVVIQAPSGAALNLGETFTIDGTEYTFADNDTGNNIILDPTATPAQVAQAIAAKITAVQGLVVGIDPVNQGRISVAASDGSTDVAATNFLSTIANDNPNIQYVPISADFDAIQVKEAVREALAREFNVAGQTGNLNAWPSEDRSIFLFSNTVRDPGPLGLSSSPLLGGGTGLQGDDFGESGSDGPVGRGSQRGQDNIFEGVYIDDIIVGFAERGETVTYQDNTTPVLTGFVENPRHEPVVGNLPSEIETGSYQIEIRRGASYAIGGGGFPSLGVFHQFFPNEPRDTNDRYVQSPTIVAPFGHEIVDGQSFTLSDGIDTITFEFDDVSITSGLNDGVAQGVIAVPFSSADDAAAVGRSIRDAINSLQVQASLNVVAGMSDGAVQDDVIGIPSQSRFVNLHGKVSVQNNGSNDFDGDNFASVADALTPGVVLHGFDEFGLNDIGDANLFRDQGQILVHSNVISDAAGYGIVVDAGTRNHPLTPLAGALARPGSVRNLLQPNEEALVPGPVLFNNLIYANAVGGILFSGDNRNAAIPEAPMPFGRVVNNTVVGLGGSGIGIHVTENASPTLLNNVVASLSTGIEIDGSSSTTVVGATAYKDNGINAVPNLGTNPIVLGPSDPLFVDAGNRNFYPAEGTLIIDASIDSLNDRSALTAVRDPLGIAVSPILAPDRDLTGVLRVDDPDVSNPNGTGGNPFKDRGAFDRADFFGPVAIIQQPIDNDPDGIDEDGSNTFIQLSADAVESLEFFSILLFEDEGTGPDPSTVTADAVILTENGRRLTPDADYVFGYNASSRLIRLTPLSGVWRNDSVYEITLNNRAGFRLAMPDGSEIADGDSFTLNVGADSLVFEFDSDGSVADGSIAVPYEQTYSRFEITAEVVAAIRSQGLFTYAQGNDTVMVHGADGVADVAAVLVPAITDIADNPLQANRINSLTQFTILMPDVQIDFGDAASGSTALSGDGSRHALLPVDAPQLALGTFADADNDGTPSTFARADDRESTLVDSNITGLVVGNVGQGVLQMPAPSAGLDGQTILISDLTSTITLELDLNGSTAAGAIAVDISTAITADEVAIAVADAANSALFAGQIRGIAALASGSIVDLGVYEIHTVDVSGAPDVSRIITGRFELEFPGIPYSDGQFIELSDGVGQTTRFELNDTASASVSVSPDAVAVNVDLTTATTAEIVQAFADAISLEVARGFVALGPAEVDDTTLIINGDDEDGVDFGGLFNADSIPVTVSVTSTGPGFLDVWVDWNQDGSFTGTGERIVSAMPVRAGTNTFDIVTPESALTGFTMSRFRVSTKDDLLIGGVGIGGEVEDHLIEIVAGSPPVTADDEYSVNEDEFLTVTAPGVLANDSDADSASFTVRDEDPLTPGLQPLQDVSRGELVLFADGSFVYTPAPDFFGTDTFVYQAIDARLVSGTPATVTITVNPINDMPTATDDEATILEDQVLTLDSSILTGNDFRGVFGTASQTNELNQDLSIISATVVSPASLVGSPVDLTDDVLTFTPPAHYNDTIDGPVLIEVTIQDNGQSFDTTSGMLVDDFLTDVSTLTVSITAVNDAPSFTLSEAEITVFEDDEDVTGNSTTTFVGFAVNPTQGPDGALDETTLPDTRQQLTFETVSVSEPSLFEVQPSISPEGDLSFVTADNQHGQAVVVVRLMDDGEDGTTGNGDENTAVPDQTFTINIMAVNDPPEFDIPTEVSGFEDQGPVQVSNFATNLIPGPDSATDEADQQLIVSVVAADPSAFTIQPEIGTDGTLNYETGPDVNSDNADLRVFVTLTDDGTPGPLPDSNSETKTFLINADAINDAPTFNVDQAQVTVIEDVEQFEGTAITTLAGLISNPAPGPATAIDEISQVLNFEVVSVSSPDLFEIQPSVDQAGTLTFKTALHKNGTSLVVVQLVDDGVGTPLPNDNDSILQTLTITLSPINDAPEFSIPGSITVNEDAGLVSQSGFATNVLRGPAGTDDENIQQVSFTATATDPSAFTTQPTLAPDGTLSFQTAPDVNSNNANLEVTVQLMDNGAASPPPNDNSSDVQTFTIIANPVNDPPIPDEFAATTDEDTAVTIDAADVLVGDAPGPDDEAGQSLTMTQIERTSLNGGTVEPVFSGTQIVSFTYTPPANLVGDDSFLYVVTDDGSPARSGSGTIVINISGVNDAPEFSKGSDQIAPEDSGTVTVESWATNILAGPANALDELASQSVNFDVSVDDSGLFEELPVVSSDGTLTFKPSTDANGTAVVTVTAVDDGASDAPNVNTSAPQTFTITISPVNDAPAFTSGPDVTVDEDSGAYSQAWATDIAAAAGLLNDPPTATDEAAQVVDFAVTNDQPALFTVQPSVSSDGQLEFTPAENAVGSAVVVVTAVDRGPADGQNVNTSAPQTFTITLTPINDPPLAVADNYNTDENSILSVGGPGLLANDTDVDLPGDSLSAVAATTTSSLGAVVVINEDGSFSYDPSEVVSIQQMSNGQSVLDNFTYTIEDSEGLTSVNNVSINVSGVDDPPVAIDDAYSMGVGQSRLLDVLTNDTDIDTAIDPRTITITSLPTSGSATVNQTGVIEYQAGAGFRGVDQLGYTVRDGSGNISNEAFVTITINNPPIAQDDSTFTFKNEPIIIDVLDNDSDPDGTIDPATLQIVANPSPSGTAVVLDDGTVEFTPSTDFFGNVEFSYVVSDDIGTVSNVADVLVRVQRSRWQNPNGNLDVNADGFVTPIDALIVVNYLNGDNESFLPSTDIDPAPFLDPTGDESVTPLDALVIINFLNNNSGGGGAEGEADLGSQAYVMMVTPEQIIATVGEQVVREIQESLDQSMMEELGMDLDSAFIGPVLPAAGSLAEGEGEDDDSLFESLTCSDKFAEDSMDEALADMFDDDDQMGPFRS